jgi:hypothetical protein
MKYLLLKGPIVMGARRMLFPIALAVVWVLVAAMTVADFASFAASTQAPQSVAESWLLPRSTSLTLLRGGDLPAGEQHRACDQPGDQRQGSPAYAGDVHSEERVERDKTGAGERDGQSRQP